jgi:hypothetical protein
LLAYKYLKDIKDLNATESKTVALTPSESKIGFAISFVSKDSPGGRGGVNCSGIVL